MDFMLSEEQRAIEDGIGQVMSDFGDDYWLEKDKLGGFPEEFYRAMAEGGWLGVSFPEEVGGANLGIVSAAVMMRAIASSSGGMAAASAIHMNVFGPKSIAVFGTDEQKQRWLPPIIKGEQKSAFGVTEPNAGLDTGSITTRAEKDSNGDYVINGRKVWTSTAQVADKILLLARTTPKEDCERGIDGLSLFYADLDRSACDVREIDKMGRKAVDSNEVFIDNLKVSKDDLIGEEGKGFRYILYSMNPERILIGSEAVGIGQEALRRASEYAKERVVFGRPIGQNQGIQHPLAESWAQLEAAWLLCLKAASLYDAGEPCGAEANAAKYLGSESGFTACERAVLAHGGMGYAKEFHVERLMREVMINRIAPVSQQLVLNFLAERVLGLPKSY
ncbi:MAG: acyl-CoA/acyl-ACP dehydrogenase [Rhodospirillaceae bacterium]|jgi:acyl-CoA dehydrogenase|nr:acyl-CoA/acyl-ACP dehydrogenase [Rhodospirillaceae bacterium]